MNRKPLGSPVRTSFERNCLLCSRYSVCRDPDKDLDYACSKFTSEFETSFKNIFEEERDTRQSKLQHDKPNPVSERRRVNSFNSTATLDSVEKGERTIGDLIKEVLNSGVPVPPDLRIDDSEIERPRNIVEWITEPRFVGSEEKPFGKQIQVMSHFYSEWCPKCSDEEYFECVPVEDRLDDILEYVVFLEHGVCPNCHRNKHRLVKKRGLLNPFEFVGIVGQRGSKTITTTQMESYDFASWLLQANIPATYNILPSTVLTSTYTATTFGQAKANFWDPFNSLLLGSEWFKLYHRFLDRIGSEFGEELYKHSEQLIAYRHKNIFASPASPSMRALRGRTRIGAVVDEAGWFKSGKTKAGGDFEQMNGKEVLASLRNSLRTMKSAYNRRFEAGYYNIPKPSIKLVSSPSARNDLIMSYYREVQGSKEVYSFKYPTWEFNPLITKADLDEDFRIKPMEANRDFGCEPPMAASPWIKDEDLVFKSFEDGFVNAISLMQHRIRTNSGKTNMSAEYKIRKQPNYDTGGVMAIDAGATNNSFSFAIAFPTTVPDFEDENNEDIRTEVEFALVGEIMPNSKNPISFTRVYLDVLKPLCHEFNIAVVLSDRWQNKKIVQDLEDSVGTEYYEIRLGIDDFAEYRAALYENHIVHPQLEMARDKIVNMTLDDYPLCFLKAPVSHLAFQMLTVQDTGNSITKGENNTTDDILRACVLAFTGLQDEEILESCVNFTLPEQPNTLGLVAVPTGGASRGGSVDGFGVSFSRSGAGGGGSPGGGGGGGGTGVMASRRR